MRGACLCLKSFSVSNSPVVTRIGLTTNYRLLQRFFRLINLSCSLSENQSHYRSGTVNTKSFVGKVLFELRGNSN